MRVDYTNSVQLNGALWGMFIGDALAMPVHWYYDTEALIRDYGQIADYLKPKNPHPDSILWRSSYTPPHKSGDILHDQRKFWGKKGIHYHQFLRTGENTLNLKLARELIIFLREQQCYEPEHWLNRMISYLRDPASHQDTYLEEYLRAFFTQYARGKKPVHCGRQDENHIGGFSLMLPILFAFSDQTDQVMKHAISHLGLTHGGDKMRLWGEIIVTLFLQLWHGRTLEQALAASFAGSTERVRLEDFSSYFDYPDSVVISQHFSAACYVDYAVPATCYLALKYQQDPERALIANTMCGGDNCGRGALLGAILGTIHGNVWPARWVAGLRHPPPGISPSQAG